MPGLISKVNLSRGLIKTEDRGLGPVFRSHLPVGLAGAERREKPIRAAARRRCNSPLVPSAPSAPVSDPFAPMGSILFHVPATHRLILCINIVLYFAGDAPIISYFVINIFRLAGPRSWDGALLCIAEGKPAGCLSPRGAGQTDGESVGETRRGVDPAGEGGERFLKKKQRVRGQGKRKKEREREEALDTGFLYRTMPTGIFYYPLAERILPRRDGVASNSRDVATEMPNSRVARCPRLSTLDSGESRMKQR